MPTAADRQSSGLELGRPTQRRRRVWRALAIGVALLAGAGGAFTAGVLVGRASVASTAADGEPAGVASTFQVFWQAWDLVRQHYVDQSAADPRKMTYGATEGMLDALGDTGHTRFLSPEDRQAEAQALTGHLEGIGAEIEMRDRRPIVVAPLPGSPAQQSGLRAGDVIVRVNGQDIAGLPLEQVVTRVRGPVGSSVTLTVIHPGQSTLVDVSVTRQRLTVPSVTWARLPGTPVAHVLVSQFAEHAGDELARAVSAARSAGTTGVILDLRNDPGGLRDEALAVASQFLREGTVLIEQDAQGHRTSYPVRPGGTATDLPLVGLINAGTASSAGIVAGALQDHHRARLVGTTTFGTGTVLSSYPLSDGSAILLGTQEWFTPDGHQTWHRGISPDLSVELPAQALPLTPETEAGLGPEQLRSSQDRPLLRALDELTGAAPAGQPTTP